MNEIKLFMTNGYSLKLHPLSPISNTVMDAALVLFFCSINCSLFLGPGSELKLRDDWVDVKLCIVFVITECVWLNGAVRQVPF